MKFPKQQFVVAVVALPLVGVSLFGQLNTASRAANEASAVGSVRVLNTAETTYANSHPQEGFACTLSQLEGAGLINSALASGRTNGYTFVLNCGGEHAPYKRVTVQGVPNGPGSGTRAFCSDLYVGQGTIIGGIINLSNDGRADTCFVRGAPLR